MISTAMTAGSATGTSSIAADPMRASLKPVAAAIVDDARHTARSVVRHAKADARDVLAGARAEADAVLSDARAQGESAASRAAAADLAAARAEARALVLAARCRAYESLRKGTLEELARGRNSIEVQALAVRLATLAMDRLGDGAVVHRSGPAGLDVVAELGPRCAGVSAAALVDHQLAAMAQEVERLWS